MVIKGDTHRQILSQGILMLNIKALAHDAKKVISNVKFSNKRHAGINGHLIIRDFTLTSCQKGSYLYIITAPS